jgi:hypothetical protein
MNLKILSLFCAVTLVLVIQAYGQADGDFFVVGRDTTFCNRLRYRQFGDRSLLEIQYMDLQGNKVQLIGRKNLPDVLSFRIDGVYIDKNPFMPNQGGNNYRYDRRYVDGKLKVYLDSNIWYDTTMVHSAFLKHDVQVIERHGPTGSYRFLIKMQDGKYYNANSKKDRKQYIEPLLYRCEAFARDFKGTLAKTETFASPRGWVWNKAWGTITQDEENFMEAIVLYNSLCD